ETRFVSWRRSQMKKPRLGWILWSGRRACLATINAPSVPTVPQRRRGRKGGIDTMSIAEDYLRYVEEQIEAHDEDFRIDNDDKAEWAVRKIRQAQLAIEKRRQFVQAEIERLQAWQQMMDERDQATIDRMTGLLQPYFEAIRPSLGKRKSYSLPSGTLQVRTAQVSYARDEEQLLPYARQIGLLK